MGAFDTVYIPPMKDVASHALVAVVLGTLLVLQVHTLAATAPERLAEVSELVHMSGIAVAVYAFLPYGRVLASIVKHALTATLSGGDTA